MSTTAVTGRGTILSHAATLLGTYVPVAELVSVGWPSITAPTADATHYASGVYGDKIPTGFLEPGDVPFEINATSAAITALLALNGEAYFWKILVPLVGTFNFPGVMSLGGSGSIPVKDTVRIGGTITITGDATFVAAV